VERKGGRVPFLGCSISVHILTGQQWEDIVSPEGENLYTTQNMTNGGSRTGYGESIGLRGVDPEGVDLPVSIRECLGVLVDDWWNTSINIPPCMTT
jgi:hypothetical protein